MKKATIQDGMMNISVTCMKAGGYRYIYVYKRQIKMAKYEEGNDTRWNDEYICDMYESVLSLRRGTYYHWLS
jgi:hypothetical protein